MYCLIWYALIIITSFSSLLASGSSAVFKKYKNKYFVETGSYKGDGIQLALDLGYEKIHSVEILPDLYQKCKERFQDNPNVKIWLGDSSNLLWDMIKDIHSPITFWLDRHYSEGPKVTSKNSPILDELEAIKKHPIKKHVILIDDARDIGSKYFDYITKDIIISKILEINPSYKIVFEDCATAKGDILVAYLKED